MAVKELITLRRDRPLLKSFTTSAFNGSPSPAEAAPQLVKAFEAAARVSASQWRDTVRGTVTLVPKADLLRAGGREIVSFWVIVHRKRILKFSFKRWGKRVRYLNTGYLYVRALTSLAGCFLN